MERGILKQDLSNMAKSVVITFNESDENLLMAFLKRLNIKTQTIDAEKEARI